jgi:hypothetical protein
MLFGDAKASILEVAEELKALVGTGARQPVAVG